MLGLLGKAGYRVVPSPEGADVVVVNTCAFIDPARRESIEAILEVARLKEAGSVGRLVVAGCLAQRSGPELARELPEVDCFVGTSDFPRLPEILGAPRPGRLHAGPPTGLPEAPRILLTPPHTAYVKIAEGCDKGCAFCAIPQFRGAFRSRPIRTILDEIEGLRDRGVLEVNLVSQDTTAYGGDRPGGENLAGLLGAVARVRGIRWARLLYCYPALFTEELLGRFREGGAILPYVDLPIQHASNAVLKRMRRPPAEATRRLLDRLRSEIPEVVLRTSVLVGFPGETEAEFQELLRCMREVRFDHLGAFSFSPEEGTPAERMPGAVPEEVRRERVRAVEELQEEIAQERNARWIGRTVEVLVEEYRAEEDQTLARLWSQAPEVDGCVRLHGRVGRPGGFLRAVVEDATPWEIFARPAPNGVEAPVC